VNAPCFLEQRPAFFLNAAFIRPSAHAKLTAVGRVPASSLQASRKRSRRSFPASQSLNPSTTP
jgi:hypothetical protein